jgi:hypothetical protein
MAAALNPFFARIWRNSMEEHPRARFSCNQPNHSAVSGLFAIANWWQASRQARCQIDSYITPDHAPLPESGAIAKPATNYFVFKLLPLPMLGELAPGI